MGRKKPTARDDENPQQAAGAKSKKKALVIEDDEYSIGTELSEESQAQEEKVAVTGKKGKKGNSKASKRRDDDDFDDVGKGDEGEDEVPQVAFTGKKKGKSKKSGGNSAFSSSSFGLLVDEDGDDDENSGLTGDDDEGAPVVSFSGKKKASKSSKKTGGSLFSGSAFDAIGDEGNSDGEVVDSSVDKSKEDDDSENEDEPVISFTGKKKPSKGGKKGVNVFAAASFDALDDADEDKHEKNDEDDEVPQITFSGKKKKSSKVSKKSAANSLSSALLDEGNDQDTSVSEPTRVGDDTVDDEDASVIAFTGKKKSSKKKGNGVFTALSEDTDVFEPEQPNTETSKSEADDSKTKMSKEVLETSKSKKKKKKSGRTAQEEDDLDNILAELGEGPTTSKPAEATVRAEKVEVQPDLVAPVDASGEKEGEEETGESAAAKKKRKKKEKEKEKKAAAAAAAGTATAPVVTKDDKQEETQIEPTDPKKKEVKGKVADKKLPKHVREMQEALARRQELEERLKREAEEKQRKEEEELRKQEELEREKEAARILRKEREKEKLQRKKQEGKFLTPKQKEEQRRREAMRNQILANAGGLPLPTADNEKKAKRPMYQKKKTKAAPIHANGAASAKPVENLEEGGQLDTIPEPESGEFEKVEDVESVDLEEKSEVAESVKDNGVEEEEEEEEEEEDDDDDDPWDVKSFDDVSLSVKHGFSDEEIDSQPVAKKDIKSAGAKPSVSAQKTVPSQPIKSQDGENKKKQPHNDVDKSKKKDVSVKKAAATSNADPKESGDNLRSPICCIMGHVDTGKTKLLDCIRGTNVQEGEAGGITQQIGATYFPAENIRERTKELKADAKLKVPGLLVIDTPGHESFTNLRSRGSGLCDIAILVVDIMHGLEPQTIESLNLLKMRNTEFIVALNKVDRLYGWKTCRNAPIVKAMKQQSKDVQNEFNMRLVQIITQFKEQGLNTELYYKNKEMGETYSIIPTSAISGEGIPDLLLLLVQWTQKTMVEKLTFSNEIQCTVLEVKVIEGLGTTIDVVLVNGVLHEGDQIVVCGMQGPIVATIRSLLTPHPMKELRVKGAYLHHSEIKAAQGIKISAQGLEHAIAGTALHVVGPHDDLDEIKETAMEDMKSVLNRIDKSGEGVCVQASTLGSLEALLEFLKTPVVNIPVSGISIGPVHKKDVMKASVMLEKKKEFATILAFDVKVTPEAREMADDLGVKIFIADIIYHLFDQFKAYIENIKEEKKKESADEAVFPCVLKIMPNCVFNKKDPIILGVEVLDGILKVGTPICIPQRDFISIGRIASIENNHKPVDTAKKGSKLAIKIIGSNSEEQQKMFGRHFEIDDELVSQISRNSIDVLKANYRDELSMEEWKLLVKLKKLFEIP